MRLNCSVKGGTNLRQDSFGALEVVQDYGEVVDKVEDEGVNVVPSIDGGRRKRLLHGELELLRQGGEHVGVGVGEVLLPEGVGRAEGGHGERSG